MKKFYYIRDFSTELHFDNLSPVERLLLSATLTKFMEKDDRDSADIIFETIKDTAHAYRNWISYRDYIVADDKIKQSKRCFLYDAVIKLAESDPKMLHYVKLDIANLNVNGRNSLATIAWKAFALAAAQHSVNDNNDWFDISVFEWKQTASAQFKRTLKEIEAFLTENDIYAKLIGRSTVRILNKKAQDTARKNGGPHLIGDGVPLPAVKEEAAEEPLVEEEEYPIAEPSKHVKAAPSVKTEELFDAEELTAEEKAAEEEWLAAEGGEKEEEEAEKPSTHDDDTSTTYTAEDWKAWYDKAKEAFEAKGKHNAWLAYIGKCRATMNLNEELEKVGKKHKMKWDALQRFIKTGYVDDRDGGYTKKQELQKAMKELQDRVLLREDDDSWTGGDKMLGHIFVAYAYKCWPFMSVKF